MFELKWVWNVFESKFKKKLISEMLKKIESNIAN